MENYLVTFFTHFDAIEYIKFLKKKRITGTLRPVPRKVSSSCGTCVTFELKENVSNMTVLVQDGCENFFLKKNMSYKLLPL